MLNCPINLDEYITLMSFIQFWLSTTGHNHRYIVLYHIYLWQGFAGNFSSLACWGGCPGPGWCCIWFGNVGLRHCLGIRLASVSAVFYVFWFALLEVGAAMSWGRPTGDEHMEGGPGRQRPCIFLLCCGEQFLCGHLWWSLSRLITVARDYDIRRPERLQ